MYVYHVYVHVYTWKIICIDEYVCVPIYIPPIFWSKKGSNILDSRSCGGPTVQASGVLFNQQTTALFKCRRTSCPQDSAGQSRHKT